MTSKTQEFIEKANRVHNFKYDYSKINYKNTNTEIIIICLKHNEFKQKPRSHLSGIGCKQCLLEQKQIIFIEKCNLIHHNKYDYSKVNFVSVNNKIEIICPVHKSFYQMASRHSYGHGCPACGSLATGASVKLTLKKFIDKANKIHNFKYNYSLVEYKGIFIHVIIKCPKHQEFIQAPHNHLSGLGCYKCSKSSVSKSENKWLDYLKISSEYRQTLIKVNETNYFADAYDPKTNIIYEYYGDYWHGNPKKFDANGFNKVKNKTFGQLYDETIERENILKNAGYKIISIWESDWKKLNKELKSIT